MLLIFEDLKKNTFEYLSTAGGNRTPQSVPILRVNNGPVPSETPPPLPRDPGDRAPLYSIPQVRPQFITHWRPRFLYPRYIGVGSNPFEESTEDSSSIERENIFLVRGI